LKVRIFTLAKELGMDSKVLIKHCNDAGVYVKSSALASISPEDRDIVTNYLKEQVLGTRSAPDAPDAPLVPSRDVAQDVSGRLRTIKTMAPRAITPRARSPQSTSTPEVPSDPTGTVTEARTPDSDGGLVESEQVALDSTIDQHDGSVVVAAPDAGIDSSQDTEGPISRDDYVPASGSTMREMKPRGTTMGSGIRKTGRTKGRAKSALPNIAEPPAYELPQAKKSEREEEPVAQKPDLKLTADIIEQQSPLAAHLRKSAEQRKNQPKRGERSVSLLEARQQRRERRQQARQVSDEEAPQVQRARGLRRRRQKAKAAVSVELKTEAIIEPPITVRSLSEALGRPANVLLRVLMQNGQMVSINDIIEEEIALELAVELGVDLEIKRSHDVEEELLSLLEAEDPDGTEINRPPIVTILGHVDHGKTSLLDKIRSSDVAGGEAGGITQHIASYQVEHNGRKLTFVDTPGHAAFGEMRARGANVTDIVVLVVAADDGVMPQTVECISHAKAAGAPVVVALNKMDLPDVNEQKVLADLAANEITPQEWGGDTDVIRTSAETGDGIDDLLETLLVTAELHEFKTKLDCAALGVCLEAFRDGGRGALAWLMVQKGTLRIGDIVLCGKAYGRIRAMYNDRDEDVEEAGPSTPVKVAGLDVVPDAGNHFFVMDDLEQTRETADARRYRGRTELLAGRRQPRTLDDILTAARGGIIQDLPLILKADSPGSIEALKSELDRFQHPEVRVNILHEGVGGVNESDVYLASASGAIIIAFHVIAEDRASVLADREGVEVRRYRIIYEVSNDIKRSLEGLLVPERVEIPTGRALVLQTFRVSRYGTIAGCRVLNGTIERSNRVHVIRDQKVVNDYNIASLRREKDDVREVRDGMECGIRLDGFNDIKEGDLLDAFRIDIVQRTLD